MRLVGRLTLVAVFGVATSASAIIISGGPSTSPPGGGSCSVASGTAPDMSGGVTVSCSGLNPSASGLRRLYFGINNAPFAGNGPNGDTMNNTSPTGTEVFRYSTNTANSITYSGTTSIFNAQTGVTSGVNESNLLVFQSGTGSMICDSRTAALDGSNGDVRCLWQVNSGTFSTTVNVLAAFAPNSPTTNAIPAVFDPTHTTNGKQEIDHVNLAFYWDTCGNGVREGDEQCDDGASNGTASDCCDANCNFVTAGTVCRPSMGPCDVQETCSGTSGTCPLNAFLPATAVCRPANGACDVAENCTGANPLCPPDAYAPSTTVCRPAAGACDAPESCTGTSPTCPADGFLPSTTVCRASAGVCDVAEDCTGASAACPADQKQPSGTACPDDGNPCTLDRCDGSSALCQHPAGNAGTVCRVSAGACDVAETCDGTSTACPPDAVAPASTVCRPEAGTCDVAESCDGSSAQCPSDAFKPATVVCRPSAGDCDVPESCTGTSATCPPDSVQGAFVECRPAAGPCDQAENCDGTTATCPPDTLRPATFSCRAAAGVCDVAETCTGTDVSCPADVKSTGVCRPAAGACDVPESCDGSSNDCPADVLQPAGTTCRAATDACDVTETCTGLAAACPPDVKAPDGTPCNDGNSCTTPDACQAGSCVGTPAPATCADHYLCYKAALRGFTTISGVHLVDEFEDVTVSVVKARNLCTPADSGGGIMDPNTHLESYSIKEIPVAAVQTRTTSDQFGQLSLTTTKPDLLLVPTAKSLVSSPPAPDENAIGVDHYKCYKVKVTNGTPKFPKGIQATITDQFNQPTGKVFDVRKPRHLCNPVDKDGEGVKNADAHLVCYQVKGAKGQPQHVRRNVFLHNEFDAETGTTIKESELCVPSVSQP